MVFQEQMTALNPVHKVGRQIAEPLRLHQGLSAGAAQAQAVKLLEQVQLPQADARQHAYPHQISGGQRQRVMIAMALALVAGLMRQRGMASLLVSHNLHVIARHAKQALVMYGGTLVESGPTAQVFDRPAHPYTRG